MATSEPISITITLDTVIGHEYSMSYDGEPRDGAPITIADHIVESATQRIVDACKVDIVKRVGDAVMERINDRVALVVTEALAAPIQRTDNWGNKQGDPTSLRAMIVDETHLFMTQKRDDRGRNDSYGKVQFAALLQREVTDAMTKELRVTMVEAREAAIAKVKADAQALIGDAVKRAMNG